LLLFIFSLRVKKIQNICREFTLLDDGKGFSTRGNHRYITGTSLGSRWRHPYIHGLCTVGWVDF
jgi:hypothetical protein